MKKLSDCHLYILNDIIKPLKKVKTVMCMKIIQLFIFCASKAKQYFVSLSCMFLDKHGYHKISSCR